MTPVRVIGIGSPHGADRSGWMLIEILREAGLEQRFPDISLQQCTVPAHLVSLLKGCRLAILVDAIEGMTGSVTRLQADDLAGCDSLYALHGFGVAEALALVEALLDPPPWVVLFAVGVENVEGTADRRQLHDLLPALQAAIEQEIAGESAVKNVGAAFQPL